MPGGIRKREPRFRCTSSLVSSNDFLRRIGTAAANERRILGGSIPGNTQFDRSDANQVSRAYASIESISSANPLMLTTPRLHLIDGEYWIGRDPTCAFPIANDTFLAMHHVRIHLEHEKWFAETRGTPNGMWIRVDRLNVHKSCAFQIGEQRFHLNCNLVETMQEHA